jgi:2-polyprenyl-6-hydroxyphenyl methylase/3-demethylubiquinone-9 3-methyltransferase
MTGIPDPKNQVCLWYESEAEEAANFYAATFPDTQVLHVQRSPADTPGPREGDVLMVSMTIMGIPVLLLNGGPAFAQSESFSFQVKTEDQEETDRYWDALVGNGGQESQCGWCKDRWGLSWQITPRQLMDIYNDPDPAAMKRAMEAMFTMKKIDIAAIETARRG